jgi:hypothetical protein
LPTKDPRHAIAQTQATSRLRARKWREHFGIDAIAKHVHALGGHAELRHSTGQRAGDRDQRLRAMGCSKHPLARKRDIADKIDIAATGTDDQRQPELFRHAGGGDAIGIEIVRIYCIEPSGLHPAAAQFLEERSRQ